MAKTTKDDLEKFHDCEIFVPSRTIYLGTQSYVGESEQESGVDYSMAEKLIKNMHFLEQRSATEQINIILNSLGGDWYHGMAIYDTIRNSTCRISMQGRGYVMSMGSVILQAADERVLMPNATVMIHDGQEGFEGSPRSMEAWAAYSKHTRRRMYEIYAERSGRSVRFWEQRCANDRILSAQEAVELGLADRLEVPPRRA